jgi:enoyl-CoA hydratase/carnithine racemase
MPSEESLLVEEVQPDVVRLTINRPPANALSLEVTSRLLSTLADFVAGKSAPAIVLTGAGSRFFCAGGDIKEVQGITPDVAVDRMRLFHSLLVAMEHYPAPLVSAVRGFAVGAGLELLLFSDYVVASEDARVGFPEINHGLLPAVKGMRQAVSLLGRKAARSLLYTGELIDVQRAVTMGIVDVTAPSEDVDSRAISLAAGLRAKDPLLFGMIKRSLDLSGGLDDAEMADRTLEDMRTYIGRSETVAARAAFLGRKH